MKISVPREIDPSETRVSMVPANVKKLVEKGAQVEVETGLGSGVGLTDQDYSEAGASLEPDRATLLKGADLVLRLLRPPEDEVQWLQSGCIHISFLDPFQQTDLVESLAQSGVSTISMEMIPRTTRAQKMDALSSQANLSGYVAVILASGTLDRILPMMTTPAGTIRPARVFVIGAGVAGLQSIATAKRLGARVEAFDTRPVVAEEVRSLGAKFVELDLGETGQTKEGYAKALTPEQLARQQEEIGRYCAQSDIVVTAAQVFGRQAPRIVSSAMLAEMKRGSVVVDLAVENGGNVEGVAKDEIVDFNGVQIIGFSNLARKVPLQASQMYSNNLTSMVEEFWDGEDGRFLLNREDEIIQGCLVTHGGKIVSERLLQKTKG